ncbi:HigA family addiction module antitoxin [Candidatus Rariloculus sp.]|uniref:HigA family addiction module antitoxin n=1 Tax=Candidatus Rariloculus sp. TaxID=3101265 RepID=UPI003D0BF47A
MNKSAPGRPEKLSPIHPGEILNEEFLRPLKITQYRLAQAIGVDARRIHAIVHGQRSITAETALLMARFFGNSAQFWMGLQNQYDLERERDRLVDRLRQIPEYRIKATV